MRGLPEKTRDIHNHHIDSTVWEDVRFRDDDIIIGTYAKSGTTWMQQIVGQLLFDAQEGIAVSEMSPWVDLRVPPKEVKLAMIEAQTHRRFMKTHLPVDALVFHDKCKYIYVGRDGRDIVWSLYNHHANANEAWYDALNNSPGRVGPAIGAPARSEIEYFQHWLENDGAPFWSFWESVRSWWEIRDLPNVLLVHFSDLKADLEGQMSRIADFIDVTVDEETMERALEHCSFDYMKTNAAQSVPLGGAFWQGGARTFIHKGMNGRWRDTLPQSLIDKYEETAKTQLGVECARWIMSGSQQG